MDLCDQEQNGWALTATNEFHITKVDDTIGDYWKGNGCQSWYMWVILLILMLSSYETAMFCRKLDLAILEILSVFVIQLFLW